MYLLLWRVWIGLHLLSGLLLLFEFFRLSTLPLTVSISFSSFIKTENSLSVFKSVCARVLFQMEGFLMQMCACLRDEVDIVSCWSGSSLYLWNHDVSFTHLPPTHTKQTTTTATTTHTHTHPHIHTQKLTCRSWLWLFRQFPCLCVTLEQVEGQQGSYSPLECMKILEFWKLAFHGLGSHWNSVQTRLTALQVFGEKKVKKTRSC